MEAKLFKYALVEGYHHMDGTEGAMEDLPAKKREKDKTASLVWLEKSVPTSQEAVDI